MFNAIVVGNIVRKELKEIKFVDDKLRKVLDIDIVVLNRDSEFVTAEYWDKGAEIQNSNLEQGDLVSIVGEPSFSLYTKKSGEPGLGIKFRNPQIKYLIRKKVVNEENNHGGGDHEDLTIELDEDVFETLEESNNTKKGEK